ncbi:MAG: HDOD domain-containing protein [Polyangiaceae bacterium]
MATPAILLDPIPAPRPVDERLHEAVVARVSDARSLPVLPRAAAELMVIVGKDTTTAKQISDVIHRDQALAAHVLRVANSPSYRGTAAIVSLQQAVARIGQHTLGQIALSASLKAGLFDVRGQSTLVRRMWHRAYATALFAKEIARARRTNVESAFLCGLLHDVGAPVVLHAAVIAAERWRKKPSQAVLEMTVEALRTGVGVQLAELWELPRKVQACIAGHERFEAAGDHRDDAAAIALARALAEMGPDDEPSAVLDHPAVTELNLYPDEVEALIAHRERIAEAMKVVGA